MVHHSKPRRRASLIKYVEDEHYSVGALTRLRFPPLGAGLLLGIGLSLATSRFEEVLANNVQIAFFIPFLVYMADAIGTQTQSIYTRDLKSGKARFMSYLVKEAFLGIIFGVIFGLVSWLAAYLWLENLDIANSVGLAMLVSLTAAPVIAVLVTELLQISHEDPAVGAGPLTTVIQDAVTIIAYGLIASAIILD